MIGLHHGALSSLLNGKRKFQLVAAQKYFKEVIPKERWQPIEKELQITKKRIPLTDPRYGLPMPGIKSEIVSDPIYSTLMIFAQCEDFKFDIEYIAKRLRRTPNDVAHALEKLLQIGLLRKDDDGKLIRTGANYVSSDNKWNPAHDQRRRRLFDDMRKALHLPHDQRDFYEWTCSIDPARMDEFKKEIRKIIQRFEKVSTESDDKEVYTFLTAFFPMTFKP